jgi:hypothetical protein
MSSTATLLQTPVEGAAEILPSARGLGARARRYLQARWTYHQTIAELQVCSERTLRDMGVTHGIDEFARRAAGL